MEIHNWGVIPEFARALIDWLVFIFGVIGTYFSGSADSGDEEASE